MIGVDVVAIERIKNVDVAAFAQKIGCDVEWLQTKKDKAQSLAGIFAIKEAVVKALGCGFNKDVVPKDIEVRHKENGEPVAVLHGKAEDILKQKGSEIFVSVSHDGGFAVAVAIIR